MARCGSTARSGRRAVPAVATLAPRASCAASMGCCSRWILRDVRAWAAALLVAGIAAGVARAAPSDWETRAPMPVARTEVSAAVVGNEIVVLGGLTLDRGASRRVDAYSPARDTWRRLRDLPIGVHHAMA